jgi:rubrerythrin
MLFSALEIIDIAVRIEENGEIFYRELAKTMEPGHVKDLFLFLADEDVRHRNLFAGLMSSIKNLEISMDAPHQEYPGEYFAYLNAFADDHIFTKQDTGYRAAGRLRTGDDALSFALQIELDSVLFYIEMKQLIHASQWPIVDQIINEERGHYLRLSDLRKVVSHAAQAIAVPGAGS